MGLKIWSPIEVDAANKELLPLLGEDENVIKDGIAKAAEKLSNGKEISKVK